MTFDQPNAVAAMNQAVAAVSDGGDCWDVIGRPLDRPVGETLPAYDEKLTLGLAPSAADKRLEIAGLAWGKIEKDAARLTGLAAAVENVSAVVRSGKDRLAHDWKGPSFDAFRAAIEKLEKLLDDYSAAVRTTAEGLVTALENVRTLYTAYRDQCADTILDFSGFVPPEDWVRIGEPEVQYLKWCAYCVALCDKEEMVRGILVGQALQRTNYEWYHDWDGREHEQDAHTALNFSTEERGKLSRKINEFYVATDGLKEPVGQALDAALENLRILAESKVFAALRVPGAGGDPTAGGDPAPGGDPGPGGAPEGGASGGSPGGGAMPPPLPNPAPDPAADPVRASAPEPPSPPGPTEPAVTRDAGSESVTIRDGDRTISVTSPDGEGHVTVTVESGDGPAKRYDLDFDAASGLPPQQDPARPETAAEHVPAGTNGQCVVRDGALTITAERPLFDPGTIKLEVDDGVNEPTTYTLEFEQQPAEAAPEPAAAPGAPGANEQVTTPQGMLEDGPGTLSGVLVPVQSTGEAELASAGAGEPAERAGNATIGGSPMMAGAGAADTGRAGTGWSVHGDLFDNHDPVYSMHGVLREDDLEGR